jgi:hypothetical protein
MTSRNVNLTSDPGTFVENLRPGDVLLFDSIHPLSQLIKLAENRPVNHSAVYLGGDRYAHVRGHTGAPNRADPPIEPAARQEILSERLEGNPGPYDRTVTAFRHVRVLSGEADEHAVVEKAESYVKANDTEYCYLSLFGLMIPSLFRTFATLLKDAQGGGLVRAVVRMYAQSLVNNMPTVEDSKKSLTCSEFVYLCYKEAESSLSIEVPGSLVRWPISANDLRQLDMLRAATPSTRRNTRGRGPAAPSRSLGDDLVGLVTFHESVQTGLIVESMPGSATRGPMKSPGARAVALDCATLGMRAFRDVVAHNLGLSKYDKIVPGEIISDAVTPRDLWSSPSLQAVAVLHRPPDPTDSGLDLYQGH